MQKKRMVIVSFRPLRIGSHGPTWLVSLPNGRNHSMAEINGGDPPSGGVFQGETPQALDGGRWWALVRFDDGKFVGKTGELH